MWVWMIFSKHIVKYDSFEYQNRIILSSWLESLKFPLRVLWSKKISANWQRLNLTKDLYEFVCHCHLKFQLNESSSVNKYVLKIHDMVQCSFNGSQIIKAPYLKWVFFQNKNFWYAGLSSNNNRIESKVQSHFCYLNIIMSQP